MTHVLKTLEWSFAPVMQGTKTFEIRYNDRDYQVGDTLILAEWDGAKYTGRSGVFMVTYMTDFRQQDGYVVMGITRRSRWWRFWNELTKAGI